MSWPASSGEHGQPAEHAGHPRQPGAGACAVLSESGAYPLWSPSAGGYAIETSDFFLPALACSRWWRTRYAMGSKREGGRHHLDLRPGDGGKLPGDHPG